MNKSLVILLTILAAAFFLTGSILIAQDIPESVEIDSDGYRRDLYGPVELSHLAHVEDYEVSCNECHHTLPDDVDEDVEVKLCVDCHNPNKRHGSVWPLRGAFHKNCRGCHREYSDDGEEGEAPYKTCSSCHERN
jgi:hypothetical protein